MRTFGRRPAHNLLPHQVGTMGERPLARLVITLAVMLFACGVMLPGCGQQTHLKEEPHAESGDSAEPSWLEQVEAVRRTDSSEIRVAGRPVTRDEWQALAPDCDSVEVLDVEDLEIPSSDLSILAALPKLRQLRIGSSVDDAGLRAIASVKSLRVLNLPAGRFTDDGLAELAQLPHLELLRFHSPHVTNAGLANLRDMTSLRFLHLINVPVSDEGLVHLHGLKNLQSFYLDGGHCTDDGLYRLLRELPQLHFHRDQLHLPEDPHAHPHAAGEQ